MWRVVTLFRLFILFPKVRSAWSRLSPDEFRLWLLRERARSAAISDPRQIEFLSWWIPKLFAQFNPPGACVLASACFFAMVSTPVKLYFGVCKSGIETLVAHAWVEWDGGMLQLDSKTQYEPLWEIS